MKCLVKSFFKWVTNVFLLPFQSNSNESSCEKEMHYTSVIQHNTGIEIEAH